MSEIETAEATDRVMAVLNYWLDGCARIDRNSEMVAQLAALAARPVSHGEGFSALQASPSVPTEGHDTAFIGHDEPIGEGGQFAYRTTLFGERHVVHLATGFVWFKLPYDYRYTDNASQRSNAETMLAALLATGASA
jgi:hypothetical protein